MKLRGTEGVNCMKAKRDYQDWVHSDQMVLIKLGKKAALPSNCQRQLKEGSSGSSPLRSDGSRNGQAGRLGCMTRKPAKISKISRGTTRLESTQDRWFHGSQAARLDRMSGGQRHSYESCKNDLGSQGTYKKKAEWQPGKKSQLTLSQGMLKRWDVEDDADDEVRTTMQAEIRVTATVSTEESFVWVSVYSSPLISASEVCGHFGSHLTSVMWGRGVDLK